MTITMRDRYRGAMVGTLCGDALGAPYEWKWTPESIEADIRARGGLVAHEYEPFDYIEPWKKKRTVLKGHPTDDSELAAALAQSLVAYPAFNPEDAYYRLRDFIHGNTVGADGKPRRRSILTNLAYGEGSTLKAALKPATYAESCALFERGEMPTPPSNGSLMRCIAVPLVSQDFDEIVCVAEKQSDVTHRNLECSYACVIFSIFVRRVLSGEAPRGAWESMSFPNFPVSKPDFKTEIEPVKGYVRLSLRAALWASMESKSFADGMLKVICLAGDTDTYAAIAGGILGAHYGLQGIPQQWLEVLQGREIMIDLADKLYSIAHS
jgi:ADP-ribosyl-[dinitrogen reductase] hydrolase